MSPFLVGIFKNINKSIPHSYTYTHYNHISHTIDFDYTNPAVWRSMTH